MATKYIRDKFSNNQLYDIPASVIAKNRATYYSTKDHCSNGDDTQYQLFQIELSYALSDDDVLLEWASNDMNWEDVKRAAVWVSELTVTPSYDREWSNAERVMVTKE